MSEPPNDTDTAVVATIAHEVNSPLAVVLANLELTIEVLARMRASTPALEEQIREAEAYLTDARAAASQIQAGLAGRIPPSPESAPKAPRQASSMSMAAVVPTRILVVDDQESVGRALERLLRGYDVLSLVDPREALARITRGERFAVILCDLMMPEMTGAVLHDRVCAIDADQASRMVFITGGATTTETRSFVARIGQPVLLKPFDVDELRTVVARVAAQSAQTTP